MVFICEMIFTTLYVVASLVARRNKDVVFIALPSAIALYTCNVVDFFVSSGYVNPVVAMVIGIQNRKYAYYISFDALWVGYESAMIFGPFAGAILAALLFKYINSVNLAIENERRSVFYEDHSTAEVEKLLATSVAIYNQERSRDEQKE